MNANQIYKIVAFPFRASAWLVASAVLVMMYAVMVVLSPIVIAFDLMTCRDAEDFKKSLRTIYVEMPSEYIRIILCNA